MRNIVLLDSGLLKYASRFAARNRLGINHSEPITVLAAKPNIKQTIYDVLASMLHSKLATIEQYVGKIDKVIVCKDVGDSWRSKVPKTIIPGTNLESSIAYKGHRRTDDPDELAALTVLNRTYDNCIDWIVDACQWDSVGKCSIEADDFMTILSRQYAEQGDFCIVLSKDADITQAVCATETGGHVIIAQPMKQNAGMVLVASHATVEQAKSADIFSMTKFPLALAASLNSAQIVAPQYLQLSKILNGDGSDDISPVMSRESNGRHYKLSAKQFDAITGWFAEHNDCGYFRPEDLYYETAIGQILSMQHQFVHKQSFEELPATWQTFYYEKFCENRKMVCINQVELGEHYNELMQAAVEQLHTDNHPQIAIPNWQVLQQLGI